MAIARVYWIDHLRTFITVLVVAHHAALAYTTFSVFVPSAYILSTAPVVDVERGVLLNFLVGYNDMFFMPLMFLLSGLFVHSGIQCKTVKGFFKDRIIRLGVPFLIAVTVLIPLAYIPSFFVATGQTDLILFVTDYLTVEGWPVGPPWFIWILLVFNVVVAGIYYLAPSSVLQLAGKADHGAPWKLLFYGYVVFCVALIPISLYAGDNAWTGIGPFDFQFNRVIFYLGFFLTGVLLGSTFWEKHFFQNSKLLGVSWLVWLLLSLLSYSVVVAMIINGDSHSIVFALLYDLTFVAGCLLTCCFFLAVFKEKADNPSRIMKMLSSNAYGIYLIHYPFVAWIQFLLLGVSFSPYSKFVIVFTGSLLLSLGATHCLRKIAFVNRLI